MNREDMPLEYCAGLLIKSPHVLKPIAKSFEAVQFPRILFNKEMIIGYSKMKFDNPVYIIGSNISKRSLPIVPMFQLPLCKPINWSEGGGFDTSITTKFIQLLRAIHEIHQAGITLIDLSPHNMMECQGKIKFIDLGFTKLYSKLIDVLNDVSFIFGIKYYRSPWAHVISEVSKISFKYEFWNLKEKLVLELIANDFWSLAIIFGAKFCKFGKNKWFLKMLDYVDSITYLNIRSSDHLVTDSLINTKVQNQIRNLFNELRFDLETDLCPWSLQNVLHNVLQVNPVIRMQNIEQLLTSRVQKHIDNPTVLLNYVRM
jgi:serine/threonine protein kinase